MLLEPALGHSLPANDGLLAASAKVDAMRAQAQIKMQVYCLSSGVAA
jgi:hypothetical protein